MDSLLHPKEQRLQEWNDQNSSKPIILNSNTWNYNEPFNFKIKTKSSRKTNNIFWQIPLVSKRH